MLLESLFEYINTVKNFLCGGLDWIVDTDTNTDLTFFRVEIRTS